MLVWKLLLGIMESFDFKISFLFLESWQASPPRQAASPSTQQTSLTHSKNICKLYVYNACCYLNLKKILKIVFFLHLYNLKIYKLFLYFCVKCLISIFTIKLLVRYLFRVLSNGNILYCFSGYTCGGNRNDWSN